MRRIFGETPHFDWHIVLVTILSTMLLILDAYHQFTPAKIFDRLGLYFVIPLYLVKELSLDIDYANTIFGLSRLGGAVLTIIAGFFVDRFSLKKACFVLVSATGILTVLLALSSARWVHVFLSLQACISPTVFPVGYVAVAKLFSQEQRGQATGFVITIGMIGTGLVPYFLGLSGDFWSFRAGIFVLGILTALSSGLFYTLKEFQ